MSAQPLVIELTSIPGGSNPYLYDCFRMGTSIGDSDREIQVMWGDLREDFVVIDPVTGQRWKIVLPSHPKYSKQQE